MKSEFSVSKKTVSKYSVSVTFFSKFRDGSVVTMLPFGIHYQHSFLYILAPKNGLDLQG